jgi:hypothetical protein
VVSRIIVEQVSGLHRIHTLTKATGNVQRAVLNLMLAVSEKDKLWAQERLGLATQEVEQTLVTMPESSHEKSPHRAREKVLNAWAKYKEATRRIEDANSQKKYRTCRPIENGIIEVSF